ncbi:MAG: hypothetical protein MK135_14885, partial [Polyangiaceae bacterium]|nr:hypothetical protein [Polyangiaceae bacterium]
YAGGDIQAAMVLVPGDANGALNYDFCVSSLTLGSASGGGANQGSGGNAGTGGSTNTGGEDSDAEALSWNNGWIDGGGNMVGIQGAFFTFADNKDDAGMATGTGTTIAPSSYDTAAQTVFAPLGQPLR